MLSKDAVTKIQRELQKRDWRTSVIFDALSDPRRLKMFFILAKHHDICVTDIAHIFAITVSAASQQLRILELSGLIKRVRMGQMICYEVEKGNPLLQSISDFFKKR